MLILPVECHFNGIRGKSITIVVSKIYAVPEIIGCYINPFIQSLIKSKLSKNILSFWTLFYSVFSQCFQHVKMLILTKCKMHYHDNTWTTVVLRYIWFDQKKLVLQKIEAFERCYQHVLKIQTSFSKIVKCINVAFLLATSFFLFLLLNVLQPLIPFYGKCYIIFILIIIMI